jgi:hypothetical protein
MRIKNLRNKTLVFGNINVQPDEEANVPFSEELMEMIKNGDVIGFDVKLDEDLDSMSMSELRKIGDQIGAKDTKKSELIEEIKRKR